MNIWLVIGSILSYSQYPDKIGAAINKKKDRLLKTSNFEYIQKGDLVIYYALRHSVIIGLFEVDSNKQLVDNNCFGPDSWIFSLKPLRASFMHCVFALGHGLLLALSLPMRLAASL